MSVGRQGKQLTRGKHGGSHVSGKHQHRFAMRIKDNLDLQCKKLERELCPAGVNHGAEREGKMVWVRFQEERPVDFKECPNKQRCRCGICLICGHQKHTAIHGGVMRDETGMKFWGHPYTEKRQEARDE